MGILVGLVVAGAASPCLWDDDTLVTEANGLPTLVDTLVGRIPINPPEYYRARIVHSERRIEANPNDFAAYDNVAMAYDRVGEFNKALEWLRKKLERMDATGVKPTQDPMHDPRYRYHANLGTVYAHMWVANKTNKDTHLLDKALVELDEAMKINPKAHFGREEVQVEILKLIREEFKTRNAPPGTNPEGTKPDWSGMLDRLGEKRVAEALIGVIALATGFENRDYILILANTIPDRDAHIQTIALMREQELANVGKAQRLNIPSPTRPEYEPRDMAKLNADYQKLRLAADEYRAQRAAYVRKEVAAGRFPDDPGFWSEYKEPPKVELQNPNPPDPLTTRAVMIGAGAALLAAGVGLVAITRKRAMR